MAGTRKWHSDKDASVFECHMQTSQSVVYMFVCVWRLAKISSMIIFVIFLLVFT